MEVQYSKDGHGVYQTLKINIDADKEAIFKYLSTTEGIQQWFPQLSFETRGVNGKIYFHLEKQDDLEMTITYFKENKTIGFTWDIGTVKFELNNKVQQTELTFIEYLPSEFPHIILDFAGWQFHMESIKSIAETGKPINSQDYDFDNKNEAIEAQLKLENEM
ncbi:SRPBCC domain-containing protein [Staphylococcus equorum]|uniref:SRPBCC domain-containing protein n=1 Tax=Staphylococcus equorum TaxID=246432 RepID=A0A9X4R3Y4_9STAP|nr:SRPBCC domain-containing protein [Staphylococcus equorum]MDG0842955.1 SRPBCC domain-containing protein [Staphylococcus equorum]MDG0859423.1 SRPBCC domain-containing protein [Staphylococcus equorum]